MCTLGLDIGGANIKVSDGERTSVSRPFPLWKQPEQLAATLKAMLLTLGGAERFAVTMTGELADCFRTKAEGVRWILAAVQEAAEHRDVLVWQTGGEFVDVETACELTPLVAAANWHALATWVGRLAPSGSALLIDIGSTTTDIIPLLNGFPMPTGRTDSERLTTGELVYMGVRRTPLIGLLHSVDLAGVRRPLANEVFATTYDLHLASRQLPEDAKHCETANGKPATREFALDRLARQLCGDVHEFCELELLNFADQCRAILLARIRAAVLQVCLAPAETTVVLSGEGVFVAQQILSSLAFSDNQVTDLTQILGPAHSTCACAYALARLGSEQPVFTSLGLI